MSEELNLVKDLAARLIAAGFFTILSKALKQPLILGYIIAGFVVGPHLGLFHLTSTVAVHEWSEIGIIFLLFALGLEFSFKKLLKVGSGAMIMAGIKCLGMFLLGMILAQIMNWSTMEGIFLGGLLSMSSTTIIIKAFDDMGLKNKPYSPIIFGSLVVEDLIAVLLMVLLSTLAATGHFEGGQMLLSIGKLVFFLVLWFLVGIYLIPTILNRAKNALSDETLLIVSIGLCFAMVAIASSVGFSSALGAFVMGSILAETLEGERIERLLGGIKDLFGAIFFVSVGMMVDPAVIGSQWVAVLILTIAVIVGHFVFSFSGALVAGRGLDTAVHGGFALSQLGEFGFIIASLGCSLGVMRDFIYPVVIAVSVITTFTTPYMIKLSEPALKWFRRKLPQKFIERVERSTTDDFKPQSGSEQSEWRSYIKKYLLRVGIYTVLLVAISIGGSAALDYLVAKLVPSWSENLKNILETAILLVVMVPFLYGLTSTTASMNADTKALLEDRHSNAWTLLSMDLIRLGISIAFIITVITAHFDLSWKLILLLIFIVAVSAIPIRLLLRRHIHMEERFMANLGATEQRERRRSPVTVTVRENLEKYNVHIESVYLAPESQFVGKSLRELPFRGSAGVNIIKIQRGSTGIIIPSGETRVYPYDRILAVGTEQQLEEFRRIMKDDIVTPPAGLGAAASDESAFAVTPVELTADSTITGKTLRELKLRSHAIMVICVLRDGALISNPSPDEPFLAGDLVWIAGEATALDNYAL